MNAFKQIILWLAFILAGFLPAFALTQTAPENRTWEIFTTGYDSASAEVTDLGSRTETSTSDYDTAPIHSAATEAKPTKANRSLFGQSPEFKAAEEEEYVINNGVRRALNTNEDTIPARIVRPGQPDQIVRIPLNKLHVPPEKAEVPLDDRFLNITPPIRTPIEVVPKSTYPGQTIPLSKVKIVPPPK